MNNAATVKTTWCWNSWQNAMWLTAFYLGCHFIKHKNIIRQTTFKVVKIMNKWKFYNSNSDAYKNCKNTSNQETWNDGKLICDCACSNDSRSNKCCCDFGCASCPPGPQGPAGASQIVGMAIVTTTVVNSVFTVRNPAGNSAALTVTPLAGGTRPVSAHLMITQIA